LFLVIYHFWRYSQGRESPQRGR